eukprot:g9225.t1
MDAPAAPEVSMKKSSMKKSMSSMKKSSMKKAMKSSMKKSSMKKPAAAMKKSSMKKPAMKSSMKKVLRGLLVEVTALDVHKRPSGPVLCGGGTATCGRSVGVATRGST